jgi:hypothetical protein
VDERGHQEVNKAGRGCATVAVGNRAKKELMYLTKYGTTFGQIPQTFGRVLFVSPADTYIVDGQTYPASDNNTGLSPTNALRTIAQAITNAIASAQEVIVLLPGTHTSAAVVNITKAGLTFVGLNPHFKDSQQYRNNPLSSQVNWTSTLAGAAVALTVADCVFIGINMIPVTARSFMTAVTCPRTVFIDCAVTLSAAASTSTKGIVFSGGSSANCSFQNCTFLNTIATSAQGPAIDVSGCAQLVIDACTVLLTGTSSAWAVAIQGASGTAGVMRNSTITALGAGTITIGFDGTGVVAANSFLFQDNKVGVTPGLGAFKNFDGDSGVIVTNYLGTVSAGTGGSLVTVTI